MIVPLALTLLAGSEYDVDQAVRRADIIVVSEVAASGPGVGGRGVTVALKPSRSLKGGTGSRELSVSLLDREEAPEQGEPSIFFVVEPDSLHLRGIKVLRATSENLEAVSEAQRKEVRLPGSSHRLYEVVRDSQFIAVAEVLELGQAHMGPPASTSYGPTKLKLVRSLKCEAEELPSPTFHVRTVPREQAESVPVVGQEYLIFIETTPGVTPHAVKILHPTEANLEAVEGEVRKSAELGRLRGRWVLHDDREDGRPGLLARNIRPTFLDIRGLRATLNRGAGDPIWDATFSLASDERPRAIDFKPLARPDEGKLRLAIYAIEPGRSLKLCVAKPGQERPKDFETRPGDGRTLYVFGAGPAGQAAGNRSGATTRVAGLVPWPDQQPLHPISREELGSRTTPTGGMLHPGRAGDTDRGTRPASRASRPILRRHSYGRGGRPSGDNSTRRDDRWPLAGNPSPSEPS